MGIALKLSEQDRIAIADKLFKVIGREKDELHGLCPIHGESNPSFSYNFLKDTYHCFSCSADGDLCDLWGRVRGYADPKEGFKAFCLEYAIEGSSWIGNASPGRNEGRHTPESKPSAAASADSPAEAAKTDHIIPEETWAQFPPLPEDWIRRLEETRGWSRETIQKLDIRQQKFYLDKQGQMHEVKKPVKMSIPIRDAQGRLVNIRHYQPGAKQYKIISWGKAYGEARLWPPAPSIDGPVLLCEGEPDTICALSNGFNAITQTSKTKNWSKKHLDPFLGRDVVIAYDADQPGQTYAAQAAMSLKDVASSVRMLTWPDFMGRLEDGTWPADHGEDLTDFFAKHGKTKSDLQALIDAARPFSEDEDGGVTRFFSWGITDRYSFRPRLLADRIMKDHKLLSDPETGLMYRWNGRHWEMFDEDHIRNLCVRYLETEAQRSRAEDATYQVKMLATIPHGRKINDQEDWICLKNCMMNLITYETRPHDPEFYCTFSLPVLFDPESEKRCDRWLEFLDQTIQTKEVIAQVQEFVGYVLTRHTKYEKCLFLYGPGADGKSTFLKILKELVGTENCAALSFQDLEDQFLRSSLYNKMLNISTEVGSQALESQYFKSITSGEPLNASFKHKNSFTFAPYAKLAFAGNRFARVRDNSDGFFRKVLPVRFKHQFLEGDPNRDTDLLEKLRQELSEIFSWAVVGLARLTQQKGFTIAQETNDLIMEYRRLNNPVLCYVEDRCNLGEQYETDKDTIYEDYKKYCEKSKYTSYSKVPFFRELNIAVSNLKQSQPRLDGERKRLYKGIAVKLSE